MPELPEVKTVVKYLNQDLENQVILEAKFLIPKMVQNNSPKELRLALINRTIEKVDNYGKFILFKLNKGQTLVSHLRMEGKYRFTNDFILDKHDHAWFKFKTGYLIYKDVRKFGTFELKNDNDLFSSKPLIKLGRLPHDTEAKKLFEKLSKKSIAIKSALLDQEITIGLGNIYVDEVLFDAKILPTRVANSLSKNEAKKIIDSAVKILDKATEEGGSSIRSYLAYGNKKGNYQNYLKVHTKVDQPCVKCNNKIIKIKVNGRGTYYCQKCQK